MKGINVVSLLKQAPDAIALINGSSQYPKIQGEIIFYQTIAGVLIFAQISGLPDTNEVCKKPVFAMHIHSGSSCSGNANDFFADAMTHYNPQGCAHPYHAGDLPPLFGAKGYALLMSLTDRFSVTEIIEKTIIIHSSPDDFTTQPSGNSGTKIACGVIKKL